MLNGRSASSERYTQELSRFARFILIGLVNTLFGYAVFTLIYLLSGSYRLAIVLATIVGVAFNFFTTGGLVFSNRDARKIVPFILGYVVICIVNILIVDGLVALEVPAMLAQVAALPVVAVLAYIINRSLVFGR